MTSVRHASALRKPLQRLALDQDGVSAVEFALLLPLMLMLYLGGFEISQAVSADRKTVSAAYTLGDLVSQSKCVSQTIDIPNYFIIANEVIYPFSPNNLVATVSGVKVLKNGTASVDWSVSNTSGKARTKDEVVTSSIPSALLPNPNDAAAQDSYLIWAETSYTYTPTFGSGLTGTLTLGKLDLGEKIFLRPRQPDAASWEGLGVTLQASGACT